MQHLCREYTMPRYEKKTRAKGGILKNTRIGPVLDIQICRHKDRYCIDVLVESLFQDQTASWVRIVSGIDKYVTESMEKKEEHRALRPVAKARPRLKPAVTLSAVSVHPHERKWIDIEEHDHDCFTVSKAMIRPPRHGQSHPREEDGAVRFDDILEEVKKMKVDSASQWSLNDWISTLAKGGRAKKRFPDCLNPNSSNHFLNLRSVQGHSGGNALDPELQDNVVSSQGFTEHIYHVGNASEINFHNQKWIDSWRTKSQKRKTICVPSLERSQCAKCAKRPKLPEQGVRLNQRSAWMALRGFTEVGDPVPGHHRTPNVGNESRCGHRNALIVRDEFPNWVQGCPMKTKDSSERIARLQRFTALFFRI